MGVMDFLFGSEKSSEMEPRIKEARNFILDQMMKQYLAGPVNVPKYFAPIDQARYSGANTLLGSLGLDTVSAPSMQTEMVNGMNVYSSEPFQTEMEANFAAKYPAQYEYLKSMYMDPVTGERNPTAMMNAMNTVSGSGGGGSSGGGSGDDRIPVNTGTNYAANVVDGDGPYENIIGYGQNDNNDVVAIGYGAGMVDPSLAKAAGYDYRDDNPYDYSFTDHVGAMFDDVSNIKSNVVSDIKDALSNDEGKFLGIF